MSEQKWTLLSVVPKLGFRSVVLFGTALSGVYAWSLPVWAKETCSVAFKSCHYTGGIDNISTAGFLIYAEQIISADNPSLTNDGNLTNQSNATAVNSISGRVQNLIGSVLYNAINGASITNSGTIAGNTPSASNANVTTQIFAVGIYNDTLGTLSISNAGLIKGSGGIGFGVDNLGIISSLENSFKGTIEGLGNAYNGSGVGVQNQGTINTLVNAGMISGVGDAGGGDGGGAGGEGAGIANVSGVSIAVLINAGTLKGTGGEGEDYGGGNGNGIDNFGSIATLKNNASGIIEGVGGMDGYVGGNGVGLYNETGSFIGALTNSGEIEGIGGQATSYSGGNGNGIDNLGSIATLTNNANSIIEGVGADGMYGGNGAGIDNYGSIATLTNFGTINGTGTANGGSGYGVDNFGSITTLTNNVNGTIEGTSDALYLNPGSTLAALNNSGVIAGDIDNESSQDLVISGGTGGVIGTLTGFNAAVGSIKTNYANLIFASGALQVNDAITIGSGFNVINTNAAVQIDAAISGSGGVIQNGSGTLILNGMSTYAGPTTVNSGMLEVGDAQHDTASISSNVTVNSGGELRGHGTINGNVINNGTIAPGGSIGILNINGNFIQSPTGVLAIEIGSTPGSYDQLNISGVANISGALIINASAAGSTFVPGQTYNFIKTGKAGSSSIAFTKVAVAGPAGQYVNLTGDFSNGTYKIAFVPTINSFGSGKFYASSLYAQNASLFDALSSPVGTSADYWMHGIGSFGHAPGASYNYKGFVVGRGFSLNQNLIIGGAISNVYTNTSDANASFVDATSFGVMAYGIYLMPRWTVTGTATVGHLGNNATRNLSFGKDKFATNGVYSGTSLRADYQLLDTGRVFITPYVDLSYLYTNTGRGQETRLGNLFDIHYGRTNSSLTQAGGGLNGGYKAPTHLGTLTAWVGLGGVGTFGNPHARVNENLGAVGASVSEQIASTGLFTPVVGIQLSGKSAPWKIGADWTGQFAKRANGQAFTVSGSYKF